MRTIEFLKNSVSIFKPINRPAAEPTLYTVYYTVRLGEELADLKIGEEVYISRIGGAAIFTAEIYWVYKCRLKYLPEEIFPLTDDKKGIDYLILVDLFRRAYDDLHQRTNQELGEEIITCIGFIIRKVV